MTDAELDEVLGGFEARVEKAFRARAGEALVRAEKRPPLSPGRGAYVRHYSFSIVTFAARCFYLDEQLAEANAALVENAQFYLDKPMALHDRDSFHWHSEMLCRFIEFYGRAGSLHAGRLSAEAEDRMLEALWTYAKEHSRLEMAEAPPGAEERIRVPARTSAVLADPTQTWHVCESENHHVQTFSTNWHYAKLARVNPSFADRIYDDGHTAEEHYGAWTEYTKAYCLERAKKGLFIEMANDGYNGVLLKGVYNFYDFAEDPVLKRVSGNLMDLFWATWAQEQIDGVRGGGRSRVARNGKDRRGNSEARDLAWFYFGIGRPSRPVSPIVSALVSDWRPSPVVVDIARDTEGRGRYELRQRTLGRIKKETPPRGRGGIWVRPEGGSLVCYSWCTPSFILGSAIIEALPHEEWAKIGCHNRWHGVIFAGETDARIVPQVDGPHDVLNGQWAVQRKGSMICQKLKTNKDATTMRVWFSVEGLTTPSLRNGWWFVEAPRAYAAVRVVTGGTEWVAPKPRWDTPPGRWLTLKDEWSPIILEVAEKKDFADLGAFEKKVLDLPLSFENDIVGYEGLSGDRFRFFADQTRNPTVNGKEIDYSPPIAFDSPFIQSEWNSGVVTIMKDGRTLVLDFNE